MARYSFLFLLIVGVALLGWSASESPGCAPAPPRGMWARIEDESALIIWQPEAQTQHFIRRATFNSTANDFGFLVPTPAQPELGEVDSNSLFRLLGQITAPKYERRVECVSRYQPPTLGAAPSAAPPVRVIDEQIVAGMDAVVLQADNPDDLGKWLAEHDYHFRPELRGWLEKYTSDKWYITAFKISAATEKSASKEHELSSKAVRMTFHTEQPFYPYREPVDMRDERAQNLDRFLRLFVLAQTQMEGGLGVERAPWPGRIVWSNPLDTAQSQSLDEPLNLPAERSLENGTLWLTEFEDRSSPRQGTDEIYFAPAKTPKRIERPRIVQYETVYYDSPWRLCSYGMIGIFLVSLIYPWHPSWPGAKWLVHLPLLQLPLWVWYESTNPYNIRVDFPVLVLGLLISAIVYLGKLALLLRIRVSELEAGGPHAESHEG